MMKKTKKCSRCKKRKSINKFAKDCTTKDGYRSNCKECFNTAHKKYRQQPDIAEKRRITACKWNKNNPEKRKISKAKSDKKCRPHIRKYMQHKRDTDIQFKLGLRLRIRIHSAITRSLKYKSKNPKKAGSAVRDLGCSITELKTYLESQFQPGMSWINYGDWHIDHIKPLINFDLTDKEQFRQACHYSNLQPLWAQDNLTKGVEVLAA